MCLLLPFNRHSCDECSQLFQKQLASYMLSKNLMRWDSLVGIATGYGLDGPGLIHGSAVLSSLQSPAQIWGPHNLLSNGYQGLFPRV
jgi:hypothetical protein